MQHSAVVLISLIFSLSVNAQDTLLAYDLTTKNTATLLPVPFNAATLSDHSSSSPGSMGNTFPLPQAPPSSHLFTGVVFSRLAPSKVFFNSLSYPARTAIRLKAYVDTNSYVGTAMMVGPCFILTTASSVFDFGKANGGFLLFDSIRAQPGFDNGKPQPGLPAALVKKVYLFKSFFDSKDWSDIALLELTQPIGHTIGWTGIGFETHPAFSYGKLFHKFSYPAEANLNAPTEIYNGDTLYYNYGYINDNGSFLTVPSPDAFGIPGQSGSTLMYTNNTDFYSVGLLSFSTNYYHYKISNAAYYNLLNVLNTNACNKVFVSVPENSPEAIELKLYPNPFSSETLLEFDYDPSLRYTLKIINALGQEVARPEPLESGRVRIPSTWLMPGVYFLQLSTSTFRSYTSKMVVE